MPPHSLGYSPGCSLRAQSARRCTNVWGRSVVSVIKGLHHSSSWPKWGVTRAGFILNIAGKDSAPSYCQPHSDTRYTPTGMVFRSSCPTDARESDWQVIVDQLGIRTMVRISCPFCRLWQWGTPFCSATAHARKFSAVLSLLG